MYRSILLSFVIVATACKVGANSASAANINAIQATSVAVASGTGTTTSDTSGATTGPIPTTQAATPGSVANTGGEASVSNTSGSSATTGSASTQSNPNRVPNEMGRIMVLEYHLITDHNGDYARERGQFRKDLELLYSRGYRPVNMSDVLDRKLDIDPTSGIGIWLDFKKTHPDWNNKAVFCLLSGASAGHNFFGDRGIQGQKSNWRFRKVKWLADNGFELCDHTLWHAQLNKYPDAFVQEQIARNALAIDSAVPGYKIRSRALPQGLWPKNRALASKGSWTNPKTGKTVTYNWPVVFEVAGGPMRSPYDPGFNPGATPRIQVIGNAIEANMNKL